MVFSDSSTIMSDVEPGAETYGATVGLVNHVHAIRDT
jgi:hypothetical protein